MTVQELIDELSKCDSGMEVRIQSFSERPGVFEYVAEVEQERVLCTMSSEFDYSVVVIR